MKINVLLWGPIATILIAGAYILYNVFIVPPGFELVTYNYSGQIISKQFVNTNSDGIIWASLTTFWALVITLEHLKKLEKSR